MTDLTSLEKKLLVSKFMGWELISTIPKEYPEQTWLTFENKLESKKYHTSVCVTPEPKYNTLEATNKFKNEFADRYLKYDTSWDWLMLVIKKINSLDVPDTGIGMVYDNVFHDLRDVDIKKTYGYVVEFINWYNENK